MVFHKDKLMFHSKYFFIRINGPVYFIIVEFGRVFGFTIWEKK